MGQPLCPHKSLEREPWSSGLLGSFLDPFWLMFYCVQLCTCCLLKLSCCSPFPQPPATPLSVFPASLPLFLPPFVSHATGCFLASPTYHGSPLPEPGNLPPAHPACSPFQNSGSKLPYKMPCPCHPSPFPLFHAFYTARCCPERQLRGNWLREFITWALWPYRSNSKS